MILKVYSRRWGHDDTYDIEKTSTGWCIGFGAEGTADCDKKGNPQLFKCLDHDSVNYPEELGGYLEWLWDESTDKGMDNVEIQEQLNLLGNWISETERNSPKGIWKGYK